MRKRLLPLTLLLLILASGCAQAAPDAPVAPDSPPISSAPETAPLSPSAEPDITSAEPPPAAPEPPTIEQAARLYVWFLSGRICGYIGDTAYRITLDDYAGDGAYYVRDLTGDGVPELYGAGRGVHYIWSVEGGRIVAIETLVTFDTVIANGGIFYHRTGDAPRRDDYSYKGLSPESREYPDVSFCVYYEDSGGRPRKTYIVDYGEVTEDEWLAVAARYFALRDAVPDKAHVAVPFSDWLASHESEISPSDHRLW